MFVCVLRVPSLWLVLGGLFLGCLIVLIVLL